MLQTRAPTEWCKLHPPPPPLIRRRLSAEVRLPTTYAYAIHDLRSVWVFLFTSLGLFSRVRNSVSVWLSDSFIPRTTGDTVAKTDGNEHHRISSCYIFAYIHQHRTVDPSFYARAWRDRSLIDLYQRSKTWAEKITYWASWMRKVRTVSIPLTDLCISCGELGYLSMWHLEKVA